MGLDFPVVFHPARSELAYRARVRLRIDDTGKLGFFNPGKSAQCAVLRRDLLEVLTSLRATSQEHPDVFLPFSSAELRAPDLDGHPGLLLTPRNAAFFQTHAATWKQLALSRLPSCLLIDFRPPAPSRDLSAGGSGRPPVLQRLAITKEVFTLAPLFGFVQINRTINEALVNRVVSEAHRAGTTRALDLYCGSGNFALPLATSGLAVHGIETVRASIWGAREAARQQRLEAQFHEGDAETWGALASSYDPDLLICDPPRAGLKTTLDWIMELGPRHLILCSCSPASLAPDLATVVSKGYHLRSVELFDMFAYTDHVEVFVSMGRDPS